MSQSPRRSARPAAAPGPGRPTPGPARAPAGPARTTSGPARAAARPRRAYRKPSFFERYRNWIVGGIVGLVAVAAVGFLLLSGAQKAYACSIEWEPSPTASPAPGATPRLGYVVPDLGRSHVAGGTVVRYTICPPASGEHFNAAGAGPIQPKVYGPDDDALPEGWLHNLEHGALVVLYRCPGDACTDAGQTAFKQFFATFPPSPICAIPPARLSPVIARFDDMKFPIAAIVWDEILPLQTFDQTQILAFFNQQAERTNPEPQCAQPSASPAPASSSASPEPSGSSAPPASATPSGSPAPS